MTPGTGHDGDAGVPKSQTEDCPGQTSTPRQVRTKSVDIFEGTASGSDFNLAAVMMSEPLLDSIDSPGDLIDDLVGDQPWGVSRCISDE